MCSKFPLSSTMTCPQIERTTSIGGWTCRCWRISLWLHSFLTMHLMLILSLKSSLQDWPWRSVWQKRCSHQFRYWRRQKDPSRHRDVLQHNCWGDAHECRRSDLNFGDFKCRDSCWMITSICAYFIGRNKNYFSMLAADQTYEFNTWHWLSVWTVVDSNRISIYWWWRLQNMGSLHVFFFRYFFPSMLKVYALDVLHRLVIYLWTKRYKCCIKSANYVMLTYVCSLTWFTSPTFFFLVI